MAVAIYKAIAGKIPKEISQLLSTKLAKGIAEAVSGEINMYTTKLKETTSGALNILPLRIAI